MPDLTHDVNEGDPSERAVELVGKLAWPFPCPYCFGTGHLHAPEAKPGPCWRCKGDSGLSENEWRHNDRLVLEVARLSCQCGVPHFDEAWAQTEAP